MSADAASYLAPPEDTWVGQVLEHRFGVDARWIWGEQTVFLGWMATLLAIVGTAVTLRGLVRARGDIRARHLIAAFFIVVTIAAVWLSLGPTAGRLSPFTLLTALPGVSLFRAPARFALLAILGVAVLARNRLSGVLSTGSRPRGQASGGRESVALAAAIMLVEWRVVTPIVQRAGPARASHLRGARRAVPRAR